MNHQVASFANRRNNGCLRSSTARRRWAWLGTEGEAWLVSPATLGLRQVPPLALSLLRPLACLEFRSRNVRSENLTTRNHEESKPMSMTVAPMAWLHVVCCGAP
jgi:hypothetical protein